jgi:hypothetical protein
MEGSVEREIMGIQIKWGRGRKHVLPKTHEVVGERVEVEIKEGVRVELEPVGLRWIARMTKLREQTHRQPVKVSEDEEQRTGGAARAK